MLDNQRVMTFPIRVSYKPKLLYLLVFGVFAGIWHICFYLTTNEEISPIETPNARKAMTIKPISNMYFVFALIIICNFASDKIIQLKFPE